MNEDSMKWHSIMSEIQFALHQTVDGIRTLAYVTNPEQLLFTDGGIEVRYKLHNGLLGYTTGLERLAKLTVSANHFRLHGEYPRVAQYSHAVARLLNAVESLDMSGISERRMRAEQYVRAGRPDVPPLLIPLLEKYAKGGGRYEYLDSLSGSDVEPGLYRDWIAVAGGYAAPNWLGSYLDIISYLPTAIYKIANAAEAQEGWDAEMLLQPYIDKFDEPLHPQSVAIALDCFRVARWVAGHLSAISEELFYPSSGIQRNAPNFPYLSEIVGPKLLHSTRDFFEFFVLRLGDVTAIAEALEGMAEADDCLDEGDAE